LLKLDGPVTVTVAFDGLTLMLRDPTVGGGGAMVVVVLVPEPVQAVSAAAHERARKSPVLRRVKGETRGVPAYGVMWAVSKWKMWHSQYCTPQAKQAPGRRGVEPPDLAASSRGAGSETPHANVRSRTDR
jgi:hypothetical protein